MNAMKISALRKAYLERRLTPAELLADIRQHSASLVDHNIWIHQLSDAELKPYLDALGDKPIAMEEGAKFAIREGGRTVGAGNVTKVIK